MDVESDFISFASALLGVPPSELSAGTSYAEIAAWDSVMHIRLVMETEEKYRVSFAMEKVPELKTLGDFISEIKSARG